METLRGNRGAVLVYVTLSFVLILLFVGLAIDVGWMTYVKNQGQASADAAALSAVSGIPAYNQTASPNDIDERVAAFNDTNTIMKLATNFSLGQNVDQNFDSNVRIVSWNPNCSIDYSPTPAEANGVLVENAMSTPLFFPRLLNGGQNTTLNVRALAIMRYRADLPLALMDCQIVNSCPVTTILEGFSNEQSPSPSDDSAFTSFKIKNASSQQFKDMVNDPSKIPYLTWCDQIELNNGQVSSTLNAIEDAFDQKKSGSPPSWCVIVPVISCSELNLNQKVEVVRFVSICITDVEATGNPKSITACLNNSLSNFTTSPPTLVQ